jgi:cytochrome c biogenesis protein CcmG/thiol:disulfide interchange protein DsbE
MMTVRATGLIGLALSLSTGTFAAEQPMLGKPAPEFRLKDLDGRALSLADLRGKLVVLHCGASW